MDEEPVQREEDGATEEAEEASVTVEAPTVEIIVVEEAPHEGGQYEYVGGKRVRVFPAS